MGFGGVGPRGVSGTLRCAGVAKALFAGSPRVGGVAGASSKLTLEIVCVRLAMSEGGLGSVADIASASARRRRTAVIQNFQMQESKAPRLSRELGAPEWRFVESGTCINGQ